eukprot:TRINITY_DN15207_c0_g1_i1.p1 TRINITY_DN15207_c0_g1~~TRINITY_DN15207_c0_g1_i1.p1  ORF type:complete len:573 (+),score=116.77 TRINITY_DN15207_c0_g1_i1:207-1721(+)
MESFTVTWYNKGPLADAFFTYCAFAKGIGSRLGFTTGPILEQLAKDFHSNIPAAAKPHIPFKKVTMKVSDFKSGGAYNGSMTINTDSAPKELLATLGGEDADDEAAPAKKKEKTSQKRKAAATEAVANKKQATKAKKVEEQPAKKPAKKISKFAITVSSSEEEDETVKPKKKDKIPKKKTADKPPSPPPSEEKDEGSGEPAPGVKRQGMKKMKLMRSTSRKLAIISSSESDGGEPEVEERKVGKRVMPPADDVDSDDDDDRRLGRTSSGVAAAAECVLQAQRERAGKASPAGEAPFGSLSKLLGNGSEEGSESSSSEEYPTLLDMLSEKGTTAKRSYEEDYVKVSEDVCTLEKERGWGTPFEERVAKESKLVAALDKLPQKNLVMTPTLLSSFQVICYGLRMWLYDATRATIYTTPPPLLAPPHIASISRLITSYLANAALSPCAQRIFQEAKGASLLRTLSRVPSPSPELSKLLSTVNAIQLTVATPPSTPQPPSHISTPEAG